MKIVEIPELESAVKENTTWTEEEEDVIAEYYPRGVTIRKLAIYLSANYKPRSIAAVEHKIARMGIKRNAYASKA